MGIGLLGKGINQVRENGPGSGQKYVNAYSDEMFATLFMPAGITSLASISFKDENKYLETNETVEEKYINAPKHNANIAITSHTHLRIVLFVDFFILLSSLLSTIYLVLLFVLPFLVTLILYHFL